MVSLLLPAYVRLLTLIDALDSFKRGTESWEAFEEFRSLAFTRHAKFFDREPSGLEQAIDQVASYEPMLAVDIRNGIHLLEKSVSTHKLSATLSTSQEAYIKLLSATEVGLTLQSQLLLKLIRRTSLAAGLLQRLKLWWYLRRRGGGKKMRAKNKAFLGDFFQDVYAIGRPEAAPAAEPLPDDEKSAVVDHEKSKDRRQRSETKVTRPPSSHR